MVRAIHSQVAGGGLLGLYNSSFTYGSGTLEVKILTEDSIMNKTANNKG